RARKDGGEGGELQPLAGKAHLPRLRAQPSRARRGEDHPPGSRGAVRRADGEQADLHALQGVHRRVPGIGADRRDRDAEPALHRAQLRAVRAVREHVPREGDHACSQAGHRSESQGGRDAERGRALQLRALRQAIRYEADGRQHARQALRPFDVRRRRAAPADVRRLPRRRHDGKQERNDDLRLHEAMSGAQPLNFVPTLPPEEAARANLYGVLARLFYAAPDEHFISELQLASGVDTDPSPLATAWRAMVEASRTAFPAALRDEHTVLFVGTGKCEVTPYLSKYVLRHTSDSPLVEWRQLLDSWGIARREGVPE